MFANERFWDYVIAIISAVSGRLASILGEKDVKKLNLALVLCEVFVAAFIGWMTQQVGIALGIEGAWLPPASGAIGFMGIGALRGLIALVGKRIGVDLTKKDGEDDKKKEEEKT